MFWEVLIFFESVSLSTRTLSFVGFGMLKKQVAIEGPENNVYVL